TPEEATATLNGEEYTHTHIEEPGEYVLVVTNGTKSVTINFTIVDDTPVPAISIEDGAQFDLYTAAGPIAATWTPEGATGTLNGEEYLAGTAITEVGEYTLTVVNGSKEVTVHFTVVDTTPQVKRGDMDGDGEITVADALKALRIAAKLAEETPEALAVGDVDGDGEITVADALRILRVAAKLVSEEEL
ncbi:MAG: dockerin type I repeat-containing protein, partial [Clostridia bacterium]|nr:dockerin type I repeat-containing protein [Clostridia bacterium]